MQFEWDEAKNISNIDKHGIDFRDSSKIFDNTMVIKFDKRFNYGEKRLIGLGQLENIVVVVVYTIRNKKTRIISIRKANMKERSVYYEKAK